MECVNDSRAESMRIANRQGVHAFVVSGILGDQNVSRIKECRLEKLGSEVTAEYGVLRTLNPIDAAYTLVFILLDGNRVDDLAALVSTTNWQITR
jgi:hypothetical protein